MIAVVDYGIGNVRSVLNALEYIGVEAILSSEHKALSSADGLILPGVGAFGEGIRRLDSLNLREFLVSQVHAGKPFLGICLGFQLLMKSSVEQGLNEGLALLDSEVVRLPVEERLPHIGWSRVDVDTDAPESPKLLAGLDGELFYFVHTFGVIKPAKPMVAGVAKYGRCEIIALVESGNIFGTQFHPEKSGEVGLQMLSNFSRLCL
jgi:glutamine amidotransferase